MARDDERSRRGGWAVRVRHVVSLTDRSGSAAAPPTDADHDTGEVWRGEKCGRRDFVGLTV